MPKEVRRFLMYLLLGIIFCAGFFACRDEALSHLYDDTIKSVSAAEIQEIVINEIAWMGGDASSADEWIELYNNTDEEIDLIGWRLAAKDGKPDILLEGIIAPKEYFLIERTDDDSVLEIAADLIASFGTGLGNSGEVLELYDIEGYLIDSTPLLIEEEGWVTGNNEEKFTMERISPLAAGDDVQNWQSSALAGGTPDEKNTEGQQEDLEDAEILEEEEIEIDPPIEGTTENEEDEIVPSIEGTTNGEEVFFQDKDEEMPIIGEDEPFFEEKKNKEDHYLQKGKITKGKIVINEIYPNPPGSDANEEFIELKNIGGQEVNILDWSIKISSHQYKISNDDFAFAIVPAGGFFILPRCITNIGLNNSGDVIELFSSNRRKIDKASYTGYAKEAASYIRFNNEWQWSAAITPSGENFFIMPNRSPKAVIDAKGITDAFVGKEIVFDASDSFDPDGDSLSYVWKTPLGEKKEAIEINEKFNSPGEYSILLEAKDGYGNISAEEFKIKILNDPWQNKEVNFLEGNEAIKYNQDFGDVVISEIMPNPAGDDSKGEWIKLYNNENFPVNLEGWAIDDMEGGSSPYYIPSDAVIDANNFLNLPRAKTGIALNNKGDEARLYSPDGILHSFIKYDIAEEDKSLKIEKNNSGEEIVSRKEQIKNISWDELEDNIGNEITISGIVSVIPGALGKQVFYLTDGLKGIEIYLYNQDFPNLERGDYVSAAGELSDSNGFRLKIGKGEDINILSYEHPPFAKEISALKKNDVHSLVKIEGEILEKKSSYLYIDFLDMEIKVYIKESAGISIKNISEGDDVLVIGILDYFNEDYRILPRDSLDLQVKGQNGQVLGVQNETNCKDGAVCAAENESYNGSDAGNTRTKFIIYLSLTLGALFIIGIVYGKKLR